MNGCERLLESYAYRELDEEEAFAFDTHVLACEGCWTAVHEERRGALFAQAVRRSAPAHLAERVRFAIAAQARNAEAGWWLRRRASAHDAERSRFTRRVRLVVATTVASVVSVGAIASVAPSGRRPADAPGDQIVALMRTLATGPGARPRLGGLASAPAPEGARLWMTVDGQEMSIRRYELGGAQVVAAASGRPFPVPAHATMVTSGHSSMAWMTTSGGVTVYCIGSQKVLLASSAGVEAVLATAHALHLA